MTKEKFHEVSKQISAELEEHKADEFLVLVVVGKDGRNHTWYGGSGNTEAMVAACSVFSKAISSAAGQLTGLNLESETPTANDLPC